MSQEQLHRVLDAALEDGGVRSPLGGLFPADLPVPTLDAALAPHLATMPNLEAHMVEIARAKAEEVAEDYPNLSADERAAIVLYTAEEQPREGSVYYALNAALRARDRAQAKPWVGFIWLLLHALKKLPGVPRPTVVRGCKKAAGELGQQAKKGAKFQFAGFTSTATTVDVMSEFIGKSGDRTMWQLNLAEPRVGRDVSDFSLFPMENEVLLPPNVRFEVEGVFDAGNGLTMVQCRQIKSLDPIMPEFGGGDASGASASPPPAAPKPAPAPAPAPAPEPEPPSRPFSTLNMCSFAPM